MIITELRLQNFKRFTDLTISGIPADNRLVLLIGSNGSGKSSVFDAFNLFATSNPLDHTSIKDHEQDTLLEINVDSEDGPHRIARIDGFTKANFGVGRKKWYGRTSFRQLSRLTRTRAQVSLGEVQRDSDRPDSFIDKDVRFENDVDVIGEKLLQEFFRGDEKSSQQKIRQEYIDPINQALERIFGVDTNNKITLTQIIPPLNDQVAQVKFTKGAYEFHYDNLSAGEKEIFNVLFNLLSRRPFFEDAVYFFDEIDLHLNTKLQYRLLQEISEYWLPEACQLWTASHSLGFIDYARDYDHGVIIDLDDLNFDLPQLLMPVPKSAGDVYEVAIGEEFLEKVFQDKTICFVENSDQQLYVLTGIKNILFVSEYDRNGVFYKSLQPGITGLVDRDFLSEEEIDLIRSHYTDLRILPYYSVENLLFHPDNLSEYYARIGKKFDRDDYIQKIKDVRDRILDDLMMNMQSVRQTYPYFKNPQLPKPLAKRANRFKNRKENTKGALTVVRQLRSSDFETFYAVFPMKDHGREIAERQHLSKVDMAGTEWFRKTVESLF